MPANFLSESTHATLRRDVVLIFPTETLYGIGCSIWCAEAVERVFEIKNRQLHQPPPVLISDQEQLTTLVADIPSQAQLLMNKFWPGSLTLILPARDDVPDLLCGKSGDGKTRTIGVRHTAHPIAAELCAALGSPLIATSANFSGAIGRAAAPQSLEDIPEELKQLVDVVVDGGSVGGLPSTVVDCVANLPRVLRAGAIDLSEFLESV